MARRKNRIEVTVKGPTDIDLLQAIPEVMAVVDPWKEELAECQRVIREWMQERLRCLGHHADVSGITALELAEFSIQPRDKKNVKGPHSLFNLRPTATEVDFQAADKLLDHLHKTENVTRDVRDALPQLEERKVASFEAVLKCVTFVVEKFNIEVKADEIDKIIDGQVQSSYGRPFSEEGRIVENIDEEIFSTLLSKVKYGLGFNQGKMRALWDGEGTARKGRIRKDVRRLRKLHWLRLFPGLMEQSEGGSDLGVLNTCLDEIIAWREKIEKATKFSFSDAEKKPPAISRLRELIERTEIIVTKQLVEEDEYDAADAAAGESKGEWGKNALPVAIIAGSVLTLAIVTAIIQTQSTSQERVDLLVPRRSASADPKASGQAIPTLVRSNLKTRNVPRYRGKYASYVNAVMNDLARGGIWQKITNPDISDEFQIHTYYSFTIPRLCLRIVYDGKIYFGMPDPTRAGYSILLFGSEKDVIDGCILIPGDDTRLVIIEKNHGGRTAYTGGNIFSHDGMAVLCDMIAKFDGFDSVIVSERAAEQEVSHRADRE